MEELKPKQLILIGAQYMKNEQDNINSPKHYQVNGLECIDVIEALELPHHLANVVKYLWRCGRKTPNRVEDLKKARWYLDRFISKLEQNGE